MQQQQPTTPLEFYQAVRDFLKAQDLANAGGEDDQRKRLALLPDALPLLIGDQAAGGHGRRPATYSPSVFAASPTITKIDKLKDPSAYGSYLRDLFNNRQIEAHWGREFGVTLGWFSSAGNGFMRVTGAGAMCQPSVIIYLQELYDLVTIGGFVTGLDDTSAWGIYIQGRLSAASELSGYVAKWDENLMTVALYRYDNAVPTKLTEASFLSRPITLRLGHADYSNPSALFVDGVTALGEPIALTASDGTYTGPSKVGFVFDGIQGACTDIEVLPVVAGYP